MSVVRLLRANDLVETMPGRRNGRRELEPESLQAMATDRYEQGVDRAFPSLELFDPGCDERSPGKRRKFRLARVAIHAPRWSLMAGQLLSTEGRWRLADVFVGMVGEPCLQLVRRHWRCRLLVLLSWPIALRLHLLEQADQQ